MSVAGYIKLYRDIVDNPIWHDKPFSKGQAWIDILLRCNHVCKKVMTGGGLKWVLRGQFIGSNYKLAEAWGWSESSTRRFIKLLIDEGMLSVLSTRHYSILEVTKYGAYQSIDNSELAQMTQNKKLKNRKNDNKYIYSSENLRTAEKLKSLILANNPGAKTPTDLSKWATDFNRMERLDKRTPEQIDAVLEFSQKDDFWKSNILSAAKLREKFDTLLLQKDRSKPRQKAANKGNFDQRQYSDADIEKFYKV